MKKNEGKKNNEDELAKALKDTSAKTSKGITGYIGQAAGWVDDNLMPAVAVAVILVGAVDSALTRIKEVPKLPEMAQGAIVVIVLSYFVSRAYRLVKK